MLWSGFQGHQTGNQCTEVHVNKIAIHIQNNLNTHTHFYRKCTVSDEQRDYKSLASLEFRISKLKLTVSAVNSWLRTGHTLRVHGGWVKFYATFLSPSKASSKLHWLPCSQKCAIWGQGPISRFLGLPLKWVKWKTKEEKQRRKEWK